MGKFLDSNYLLNSKAGTEIFRAIEGLPILDPHNHADVKEISENKNYSDLWQVEASTDHYVWELLRKRGVNERLITGDGSNEEKWMAAAAAWEGLIGNPTYEWVQLDLQRILGIQEPVNAANGKMIWDKTREIFKRSDMKPQALLKRMKVEIMCSTDDPVDTLEHHRNLKSSSIPGVVRPTFRPDKAMNIFKKDWKQYLEKLEQRVNTKFSHVKDVVQALRITHDFFAENGCQASDHGVEIPFGYQIPEVDADAAFRKAYQGKELTREECISYMAYILNEVAEMDSEKGWVFQLHMGVVRDVRKSLFNKIGPDSGGDISDHMVSLSEPLIPLLNRFDDRLKMVLYCIDPHHQASLATLTRAFGAKVNLGSAWWLNDTPIGMKRQLEYICTVDLLSNFAGMVSDSRKLLSYASRHEMFRRCLSDVLGRFVDEGRAPLDATLRLAESMTYSGVKTFWGF